MKVLEGNRSYFQAGNLGEFNESDVYKDVGRIIMKNILLITKDHFVDSVH